MLNAILEKIASDKLFDKLFDKSQKQHEYAALHLERKHHNTILEENKKEIMSSYKQKCKNILSALESAVS